MPEKLLQHKHCRNCGKAVNIDDNYCNDKCHDEHFAMLKRKRNQLYLLMVLAMGLMAATVLLGV